MKKVICIFIMVLGLISCSSDDKTTQQKFEFISEYKANITLDGIVGVNERVFEKGEIYKGTDKEKKR